MFICVKNLSFLPKNNFNKSTLNWWKNLNSCMFTSLAECNSTIASIDLWMSKGVHDIFTLMINFWEFIGSQNMLHLVF
jgi:hypothetical protein